MTYKDMRIGFVGTGSYAGTHARVLTKLGATISSCYSTNAAKTKIFSETWHADAFSDLREMISPEHVDAVYIVIPPFAHDGIPERLCIARGVPFLCEKPVGLDVNLCRKIASEVIQAGLVTSGGYQNRYLSAIPAAQNALSGHRINLVRTWRLTNAPVNSWWRKMNLSGGMMVEQATHQIDLMRFLFGEVRSVYALTSSGILREKDPNADIYDSMQATIQFKSGAIGCASISCLMDKSARKACLIEASGDEFLLEFPGDAIRWKSGDKEWNEISLNGDDGRDRLNSAFLDAVRAGVPSMVAGSYPDAVKTLELTLAMNQSAETGQSVFLNA